MRRKGTVIGIILVIAASVAFWFTTDLLPVIGDPTSPPNTHVADKYIVSGPSATNAPNMVTGVLADYRGFDTLWETTVMFLAGLAVCMILSNRLKRHFDPKVFNEVGDFGGVDAKVVMPVLIPAVIVYAIYVLMHGEVSLGGGFQAGALLAIAFILYASVAGMSIKKVIFTQHLTACFGAVGVGIYALTGFVPMLNGGKFLQYEALPIKMEHIAELHSIGILLIEIGVTIAVAATIIIILAAVLERKDVNDGN